MTEQEMESKEMESKEMKSEEMTASELEQNEKLEQMYKDAVQMEIPELWDRIEAALPKKEYTQNRRKIMKMPQIVTLVAACLCVAIILPTRFLMKKSEAPIVEMAAEEAAAEEAPVAEEAAYHLLYTPEVLVEIQSFDKSYGDKQLDGYQISTIKIIEDESGTYEKNTVMNVYVEDSDISDMTVGEQMTVDLLFPEATSEEKPNIYLIK